MPFYVIDSHPLMREAIVMLLRRIQPGSDIIEQPHLINLTQAIDANGPPDLFCVDPAPAGATSVKLLKHLYPRTPLAVITAVPAAEMENQCLEAGADVYIEKTASTAEISAALRTILTPETVPGELDSGLGGLKPETRLSKRQQQLVAMLDQGLSNRDMADLLGLSEHTVKVHLWRLFRRIGVKSRTQMLHYARTNGLLNR
jgi:DNA-binding NarL/FixJ family response regulator